MNVILIIIISCVTTIITLGIIFRNYFYIRNLRVLRLFDTYNINQYEYNPYYGITNYKSTLYGEHIHNLSVLFFKICDSLNFDYYVFAGSSIGLVRNKNMMPWTDDYDIIVFNKYKRYFKEKVKPELEKYGFNFWGSCTDKEKSTKGITFVSEKINFKNKIKFRLDIFWSDINKNGHLFNVGNFGLYNKKKIPSNCVFPKKYYKFNGMNLPFFNNPEKEVLLTYGDVHKKCIISSHSNHMNEKIVYKKWENAVHDFNFLKKIAIQNTKNKIKNYKKYYPDNKILLIDKAMDSSEIFKKISNNKIGIVNFLDYEMFMMESFNILFYFPGIKINLFLDDLSNVKYICLNYATNVYVKNNKMKRVLDELIYFKKPNIKVSKIITFGTFDLFHRGHKNIINKCKNLSDNVVIGVSTDVLNHKKGKKSYDSLKKRLYNVKKYSNSKIFKEESLEEKNNYIKKNNSNLLVMGNDWENKFNWVSSDVLYLPRTPGISSTQLRNKIKNYP